MQNIIARSELQVVKKLNFLAKYDSLTGIYNKATFFKETSILIHSNQQIQFALVHLNIKNFKLVNSFFGVETGDRFLRLIADLLKQFCDKIHLSTFGRIDSDIFGFCVPFDKDKMEIEIERARVILKGCSSQFLLHPSFGIYVIKDSLLSKTIMFDRATLAARSITENYIKCFAYYKDEMNLSMEHEQKIISLMEQALIDEEFEVWFQPKYNVKTQKFCGAEALVRWRHSDGLISPDSFIPIFERNGFIYQLDQYVWRKTCEYISEWRKMGLAVQPISVNVSRADLYNPRLPEVLEELVKVNNIPVSFMPLEITESIFSDDTRVFHNTVKRLRSLGFTILMDDFGSGYSSLNILKDVAIDTLKIDMQFLSNTQNLEKSKIIIDAVVQMAKKLGLETVAEGVELQVQADFLRLIHCDYIQGYLYAKPMPVQEYQELLSEI